VALFIKLLSVVVQQQVFGVLMGKGVSIRCPVCVLDLSGVLSVLDAQRSVNLMLVCVMCE
jgi:hypothetical protein